MRQVPAAPLVLHHRHRGGVVRAVQGVLGAHGAGAGASGLGAGRVPGRGAAPLAGVWGRGRRVGRLLLLLAVDAADVLHAAELAGTGQREVTGHGHGAGQLGGRCCSRLLGLSGVAGVGLLLPGVVVVGVGVGVRVGLGLLGMLAGRGVVVLVLVGVVVGRAELVVAGVGGGVAVAFRVGGVAGVHGARVTVGGERGVPGLAQGVAVRLGGLLGGGGGRGPGRVRRVVLTPLPPPFPSPPFLRPRVLLGVGGPPPAPAVAFRGVLQADVEEGGHLAVRPVLCDGGLARQRSVRGGGGLGGGGAPVRAAAHRHPGPVGNKDEVDLSEASH